MNKKNYYAHIDGLRAIAVLSVILMHLSAPGFSGGYVGVDIFFVISGFLITNLILKESKSHDGFSFVTFYFRRAMRILPALFIILFFTFIVSIFLFSQARFQDLGNSLIATVFFFSNIHFYHEAGYFDVMSQQNPLLHTWSLSVEEQFYLIWPISILFVSKFIKPYGTLSLVVFVSLFSFAINLYFQYNANIIYFEAPFRAFEFSIGALLVFIMQKKPSVKNFHMELLCFLGLVFISYSISTYNQNTIFPSYNALLPTVGAALIIYAGSASYIGVLLRNKIAQFIGLISYSAYLIHWPLIVFAKTFEHEMNGSYSLTPSLACSVFFVSIFLAALCYRFVEQPFRRQANRMSSSIYVQPELSSMKSNTLQGVTE